MQAEAQLFAVVQVDFRLRDGGLAAAQVRRRLVAQGGEDGLDVLAGAERVGAEIGTVQVLSPTSKPRMLTRYWPPVVGLVTW